MSATMARTRFRHSTFLPTERSPRCQARLSPRERLPRLWPSRPRASLSTWPIAGRRMFPDTPSVVAAASLRYQTLHLLPAPNRQGLPSTRTRNLLTWPTANPIVFPGTILAQTAHSHPSPAAQSLPANYPQPSPWTQAPNLSSLPVRCRTTSPPTPSVALGCSLRLCPDRRER